MSATTTKTTFALFFGNRGFFPASLMDSARKEMVEALTVMGYGYLIMDAAATRHGAVETPAEGAVYAKFLKQHEGEFDGVILCLPNFGDENGALVALKNAGVPILVQAYPDDLDKMAPALRRDAFCGKLSVTDVFMQGGVKFTSLKPHTSAPGSKAFADQVDYFAKVCRVVKALKDLRIGTLGARVTPFKTVRIDEVTLQKHGITVESYDMSEIIDRVNKMGDSEAAYKQKAELLKAYADFSCVPESGFGKLVKLGVVMDSIVADNGLDAVAVRCWMELQQQLGISPCVVMSEMNNRNIIAACEVDVGNAVVMHALSRASGKVAGCLDWNNNYADDDNKCILFHCGPIPADLMTAKGTVTSHAILEAGGGGCSSHGCNVGRIAPTPFTFSSMLTDSGRLKFYIGEGDFTTDPIAEDFFGCAGVAHIPQLQDVLMHIVKFGHRHHVSVTPGKMMAPVREALVNYLGCDVTAPQEG
jgi:L-fucose isomerase-like protein